VSDYTYLMIAVDALTKPVTVAEWVGDESAPELFRREDPPLLEQLQAAVTPDLGGKSGAGKSARERIPLDVTAFTLLEEIDGETRAWLDQLGARPGRALTTAQVIRSWLVMFKAHPMGRTEVEINDHERRIRQWVGRIVDLLSPPPTLEITRPCPECGARWVRLGGLVDEDEQMSALIAVAREPFQMSHAQCRGCGTRWEGVHAMKGLSALIDEIDAAALAMVGEASDG
jgi:hypothetical protein